MYSLQNFMNAVRYALDVSNYQHFFLKVKQYKVLESLFLGRDTIGVLPTGYGKSVLFHLLPFIFDHRNINHTNVKNGSIVLVIAPLNALIENQLSILKSRGIEAVVLNTVRKHNIVSVDEDEDDEEEYIDRPEEERELNILSLNNTTEKNIVTDGKLKLIYAHPEAFISCREGRQILLSEALQMRVIACVVDEGHLIEEWGSDFRPDFRKLSQLGSIFPSAPFLVLTATAPKHVTDSLTSSLLLDKPLVVIGNLDRPNIYFEKEKRKPSSKGEESYKAILLPIAKELKKSLTAYPLTLVYLPLRWCGYAFKLFMDELGEASYFLSPEKTEKIPENCLFAQFHSPQTDRMKREILKQLMRNDEDRTIRVLFATIAIGIGVNIPNVRHVIHIGVPRTIESYYQEVGRAGRDNKPARASLFFNGQDISTNKPGMTTAMRNFCLHETNCLRKELLVFLGSMSCRSEIKLKYERHNCCSNCLKVCQCLTCSTNKQLQIQPESDRKPCHEPEPQLVCVVTDKQRARIQTLLKKYRIEAGTSGAKFGGIDISTGLTLELIDLIVSKCDKINSAEELFTEFEMWDMTHAQAFFKIISDVRDA